MTGRPRPHAIGRAAVAVVALYALLLQAFLAAALPVGPIAAAGVVCAPSSAHSPSDERPVGGATACCVAACLPLAAPVPAAAIVVSALRDPAAIAWPLRASLAFAGPSTHAWSARGPPTV